MYRTYKVVTAQMHCRSQNVHLFWIVYFCLGSAHYYYCYYLYCCCYYYCCCYCYLLCYLVMISGKRKWGWPPHYFTFPDCSQVFLVGKEGWVRPLYFFFDHNFHLILNITFINKINNHIWNWTMVFHSTSHRKEPALPLSGLFIN